MKLNLVMILSHIILRPKKKKIGFKLYFPWNTKNEKVAPEFVKEIRVHSRKLR